MSRYKKALLSKKEKKKSKKSSARVKEKCLWLFLQTWCNLSIRCDGLHQVFMFRRRCGQWRHSPQPEPRTAAGQRVNQVSLLLLHNLAASVAVGWDVRTPNYELTLNEGTFFTWTHGQQWHKCSQVNCQELEADETLPVSPPAWRSWVTLGQMRMGHKTPNSLTNPNDCLF